MTGSVQNFFQTHILRNSENSKNQIEEANPSSSFSPCIRQVFLAIGPLLLTVSSGMTFGYSAILIPQLQVAENNTISIDRGQASWIASIATLPMAVGSVIGGFCLEQLGRKATHTISCLPIFLGWLLIYLANGIKMILLGRFITGLFTGILTTATAVYIGETCEPAYRGILLAGISFCVAFGLFTSHLLGTFLSWQNTAMVCSLLPLISQIIIYFPPESATWLAGKARIEEAEQAFYWYRGASDNAKKELNIILQCRKHEAKGSSKTFKDKINDLLVPEFLKPLGIISIYIITKQWSGINAITFYSIHIMQETIGKGVDEYISTLIIDLLRLCMSVVACFLLKKIKRRPLAILSGVGTFLSLLVLSFYVYIAKIYPPFSLSYIPLSCLICFIIFSSIGLVPLPSSMLGEVFPLRHRSKGSGISSFIAFSMFFSVVKCVPGMFGIYGPDGTFLIFGVVALFSTLFVIVFLPETKDRSLHEIEESFKNKK
ncbi:facilitated trehalose transporter Tret1-like [Diabrotica virgifera virgifera]|uniref:Major facilitator superfamily (MFS) profile domain-containing protein n=1 Tax=Diabrotica virgifera virgifera TaxID=50390 RepID=A0ABM5IJP8_DIAVI|nr:facilitated trehalose transporter Tret1-like [Diabrotica virgifera virgifera]